MSMGAGLLATKVTVCTVASAVVTFLSAAILDARASARRARLLRREGLFLGCC